MGKGLFINVICFVLFLIPIISNAAFLKNVPFELKQPDGKTIHCFVTGDEFYNWVHDENNYTIIQNNKTGYYVYANLVNDELVPTQFIVGIVNPANAGLKKGINISSSKMEQIRLAFVKQTPAKPKNNINKSLLPQNVLTTGTINNIVIFIRFSDDTEFADLNTVYSNMFNSVTTNYNSMRNYFYETSFNTLTVNSTFYPIPSGSTVISYQDANPRSYFQPYDATTNPNGYQGGSSGNDRLTREQTLIANAINYVSSQISSSLNIDNDNDGYVDNVCVIVKGTYGAWSSLLWPHRWVLYNQTAYINGKQVWDYNFQLQTFLQSSGNGVLCHEMFHTLGSPDLYHYSYDGKTTVGDWDIMEATKNPPQHMGAYMKSTYGGWISTIPQITTAGIYTLNPITSSTNNCYKILSPNSSTEYFVLEYRKKTGTFENSIPGSGLLIYRIDLAELGNGNSQGPPDEVYLYRLDGDTTNDGYPDSANFSSNVSRTVFNNYTNPQCLLSDGTFGGLDLYDVTSSGSTISFTIGYSKPRTNFSSDITSACPLNTVSFIDSSTGNPTSWLWTFTPNNVTYVNSTSSASQNPQVQFTSPGIYTVSLKATNSYGDSTTTITNYINITAGDTLPFAENFENATFPPTGWSIINVNNDTTWTRKASSGNGLSTKAASVNFYDSVGIGRKDELISPIISLVGSCTPILKFNVAYRQYNISKSDTLKIFISTDCGTTYDSIPVYNKYGALLSTGGYDTLPFVPSSTSDWRLDSIDLSAYMGYNIILKFQAINGNSNNLYIDDINIYTTGVFPDSAGLITGIDTICAGTSGYTYITSQVSNATSYTWAYSGTGATITNNNDTAIISFSSVATSGILTVKGHNLCGDGAASPNYNIALSPLPSQASTIIGTANVCYGASNVVYSIPAINEATSYQWTFSGTGATITGTSDSITIDFALNATTGNLTVYGINTCGNGLASANYNITFKTVPNNAGTISGSTTPCQGASGIIYSVPVIAGVTSYLWTYSGVGATIVGTGKNATVSYSQNATSGSISVSGVNSCGNGTASTRTINLSPIPLTAGSITGSDTICPGTSGVTYTIPTISFATSYSWSYTGTGATIIGSGTSITINYSQNATSGNILVHGTNYCGSGTASSLVINLSSAPIVSGTITGTDTVCQGTSGIVYNIPVISYATSYSWSYTGSGATIIGSGTSITINYSLNATSGNISVYGTNTCGNSTASSLIISLNPIPLATGTISGSDTVCQGTSGEPYNIPTINYATSYSWSYTGTGATIIGSGTNITINYSQNATSGNILVHGTNSCGSNADSVFLITVEQIPATPIISQINDTLYSNYPTGNQWYDQNGPIINATNDYYVPLVNGNYYDIVTISSCSSDTSNIINFIISKLNTKSSLSNISVFPNPAKDLIYIELHNNSFEKLNIEIINTLGQQLYYKYFNQISNSQLVELNISTLPRGIYLLKIYNSSEIKTEKLIKD